MSKLYYLLSSVFLFLDFSLLFSMFNTRHIFILSSMIIEVTWALPSFDIFLNLSLEPLESPSLDPYLNLLIFGSPSIPVPLCFPSTTVPLEPPALDPGHDPFPLICTFFPLPRGCPSPLIHLEPSSFHPGLDPLPLVYPFFPFPFGVYPSPFQIGLFSTFELDLDSLIFSFPFLLVFIDIVFFDRFPLEQTTSSLVRLLINLFLKKNLSF